MTTASDIVEALFGLYNKPSQSRDNERYICLVEARSGAGFSGNDGSCDFVAINTWPGRGLEIVGHEVKVSYADWQRELADEHKADRFAQFCHKWWIVVPDDLAGRVLAELPTAWGLMSVNGKGKTKVVHPSPITRSPRDVPVWWWIGWLAQIDRVHKRRFPGQLSKAMAAEREQMAAEVARRVEMDVDARMKRLEGLEGVVDQLRAATGVDLRSGGVWRWQMDRLGAAWRLINSGHVNIEALANTLETAAAEVRKALVEEAVSDG